MFTSIFGSAASDVAVEVESSAPSSIPYEEEKKGTFGAGAYCVIA